MARIRIPASRFQSGRLPAVCVKTGASADRWLAVRATGVPAWTWWLLLLGVLPFAAVRWLTAVSVDGLVPITSRPARRIHRVRRLRSTMLLGGLALLVVGAIVRHVLATRIGVAALFGAMATGALESVCSVGARLDSTATTVLLTGAHPEFVRALEGSFVNGAGPEEAVRPEEVE
jgi:hypothetical protein